MLKVRQKVIVRSDLVNGATYISPESHKDTFLTDMARYAGKEATITYIVTNGCYRINLDSQRWNWTEDMFEPQMEV